MLASVAPLALIFGAAAATATLLGGAMALSFRASLKWLLPFGAGVVLGVAVLELLPEALTVGRASVGPPAACAIMLGGLFLYLALDRLGARGEGAAGRSWVAVSSLVVHSVLDGYGIGSAFHLSASAGWLLAAAVIAHDLVDGANTVVFSLQGRFSERGARAWLAADVLAPVAGILLSGAVAAPPAAAAAVFALMAGGFIYIGLAALIGQTRAGTLGRVVISAAAGAAFVMAVRRLVG